MKAHVLCKKLIKREFEFDVMNSDTVGPIIHIILGNTERFVPCNRPDLIYQLWKEIKTYWY